MLSPPFVAECACREDLEVGMVGCVQTFGNFANFHPHLHVLVTDGGFAPNGTFHVPPKVSLAGLEQLFRHRVLKMMLREGLNDRERVRLLLSWRHSGFNVDGSVRIRAGDAKGGRTSRAISSEPRSRWGRSPGCLGEHLVRYFGWYSSVRRGRRRSLGLEPAAEAVPAIEDDSPSGREAWRCWSRLIRKIYEVDPLLCPECGSVMKIIAFIEEQDVVRKILEHLRLREDPEPRAPPPVPVPIDIEYQPSLKG